MAMSRHLIALVLVLLLPACTTTGTAPPAPAPALATTSTPLSAATHDPHLHAAPPQAPVLPSPVVVPLDATTLAGLPRETVAATAHGETLQCEGVALAALMQVAGAMPAEPLRGAQLARYVQVDARDGYRAVFSLAEFDPTLGNHAAFLVDRCNGKALDEQAGPLRLVVPGEARAARSVRQVRAITVIVAP
ncbi:molybdopterin-dependent oxidoreductase [Luteimonas soli]|uniref:Molybdopterin-dependent oxidoreductase n=1 Tax=Luteimonas soli TaxID=1648966 RepID=A0ABV7XL04_9GAMM